MWGPCLCSQWCQWEPVCLLWKPLGCGSTESLCWNQVKAGAPASLFLAQSITPACLCYSPLPFFLNSWSKKCQKREDLKLALFVILDCCFYCVDARCARCCCCVENSKSEVCGKQRLVLGVTGRLSLSVTTSQQHR